MMEKTMYMCVTCGYIYNEMKMLQRWSELTDDWVCPDCHAGKENFQEFIIAPPRYKYSSAENGRGTE